MFVPTPTWPTYPSSSSMFDSRSTSTVDSWESSSSSQGGSTPPPYFSSAWPEPITRQQIGTSSQGSVWDNNDYYDEIFGREMETTNIMEEDGSHTHLTYLATHCTLLNWWKNPSGNPPWGKMIYKKLALKRKALRRYTGWNSKFNKIPIFLLLEGSAPYVGLLLAFL